MTPTDQSILKTDVAGRIWTPAARREQLLAEFEKSGLSGPEFAQLTGLKYQTFATWVQKRRRARASAAKAAVAAGEPVRWLEAVVEESHRDKKPLVLELPGGARLELQEGRHAVLAAVLVRALAGSC